MNWLVGAFLLPLAKWALGSSASWAYKNLFLKFLEDKEIAEKNQDEANASKKVEQELEKLKADLEKLSDASAIKAHKRLIKKKRKELRDVSVQRNTKFIDIFRLRP